MKRKAITKLEEKIIIHDLEIVSANRSVNDIGTFSTALNGAERIQSPNRVLLYDLYSSIIIDGFLSGIVSKRIDFVLNKEIFFLDDDGRHVPEIDHLIRSTVFDNIIRKVMEARFWGVSGLEFVPGADVVFKEIPRKHIDLKNKRLTYNQYGGDGISYDGLSNLFIVGKEGDLGILLNCAPSAIYKRGVLGDWAQFIELFGQPVRIISYDAYDLKTKIEVKEILNESGSSLALMIPKQAEFKMLDGKESNANGELQDKFVRMCNSEMSVVVLGGTESSSSNRGSGHAQSQVHAEQQMEIIKSDLKYVKGVLNSARFLGILKSYGYQVEAGRFEITKDVDLAALKLRAEIDATAVNDLGAVVDDDYVYRTYGIPKPDNYEELKAKRDKGNSSNLSGDIENSLDNFATEINRIMAKKSTFWGKIENIFS